MSCCNARPLQYANLSEVYREMNLSQIERQWSALMDINQVQIKNSLDFGKDGLLFPQKQDKKEVQFKVKVNQILKEVTISKKHRQTIFWKSLSTNSQEIDKDDSLKLGTTCISIFDIYPLQEHNVEVEKTKAVKKEKQHCRICFIEEQTKQDPLLNFCKCSGSVKFMHLECYREWFIHKIRIYKEQSITYFQFHNIRCDLCKETMPFSVKKNGIVYPILNYKKNYQPTYSQRQLGLFADLLDESAFDDQGLGLIENEDNSFASMNQIPMEFRQNDHHSLAISSDSPVVSTNEKREGKCIVFKSEKKNPQGQTTIEIILIQMVENDIFFFGSDIERCHILMGSQSASPVHAKIYLEGNKILMEDMHSAEGTFIQLRENKSVPFNSKKGLILEHSDKKLFALRIKPFIIPFFTTSEEYRIMVEPSRQRFK